MHSTEIRLAQHAGRHFKAHWIIMSKRKVPILSSIKLLENDGVSLVEPKDILTPTIKHEPFEALGAEFPVAPPPEPTVNEPCFVFTHYFKPIEDMNQSQLITNTVIKNKFPSHILNRIEDVSENEKQSLKECVLYSMTLDSQQSKLPKYIDVHNRPGITLPRIYGLSMRRRNIIMNHKLHMLLVKSGVGEPRGFAEDVMPHTTLNHSGSLIRMSHNAQFMTYTDKPLSPVASKEEVLSMSDEKLPDIFPFGPFINCPPSTNYETGIDGFGIRNKAPHTVYIHNTDLRLRDIPEQYFGRTLIFAFSHAAAFARELYKGIDGDLPSPVTLQIVHTTGQRFHMGVFQLNTLNMTGPLKNIFWHEPWETLYDTCQFQAGGPVLEGLNVKPYSILKAFHATKSGI